MADFRRRGAFAVQARPPIARPRMADEETTNRRGSMQARPPSMQARPPPIARPRMADEETTNRRGSMQARPPSMQARPPPIARPRMVDEEITPTSRWTDSPEFHSLLVYVPGYGKDNIMLNVDESGTIIVKGRRTKEENKQEHFERSFDVPKDGDIKGIRMELDGNTLRVHVPKVAEKGGEPKRTSEASGGDIQKKDEEETNIPATSSTSPTKEDKLEESESKASKAEEENKVQSKSDDSISNTKGDQLEESKSPPPNTKEDSVQSKSHDSVSNTKEDELEESKSPPTKAEEENKVQSKSDDSTSNTEEDELEESKSPTTKAEEENKVQSKSDDSTSNTKEDELEESKSPNPKAEEENKVQPKSHDSISNAKEDKLEESKSPISKAEEGNEVQGKALDLISNTGEIIVVASRNSVGLKNTADLRRRAWTIRRALTMQTTSPTIAPPLRIDPLPSIIASRMTNEGFTPSSGWIEYPKYHCLVIDLPGFEKDQVKLSVNESGNITVKGRRRKGEDRQEHFQKSFDVPEDGDIERLSMDFDGDKLRVRVPKVAKKASGEPKGTDEASNIATKSLSSSNKEGKLKSSKSLDKEEPKTPRSSIDKQKESEISKGDNTKEIKVPSQTKGVKKLLDCLESNQNV